MGRIVTVPDGAGRSVTVSNWGVAQTSRHQFSLMKGGHITHILSIPDVLDQLGNDLGVGLGLELVSLALQEHLNVLVVSDDPVVDH